jgi:hypothetical protein
MDATTSKNELLEVFCNVVDGFREAYKKIKILVNIKNSKQRTIERTLTH